MNKKIAVIGGGAAGLAAACLVKHGADITIFERGERVGRKILATGNGRCNLMNTNFSKEHFSSQNTELLGKFIPENSAERILDFFGSLGLFTRTDSEGRLYPLFNQSSGVLDILRYTAEENGAILRTDFDVTDVIKTADGYEIVSKSGEKAYTDILILAMGGKASPVTGSDGSWITILQKLCHSVTELKPVLTPIKSDKGFCNSLKGIRAKVSISLLTNSVKTHTESGEILFTDYGISGIAAMQLSRYITKNNSLMIDFAEEFSEHDILSQLKNSRQKGRCAENLLVGILPKRIAQQIIKRTLNISALTPSSDITDDMLITLASKIKEFPLAVYGTLSWENAQVTAGGVPLTEVHSDSMESMINKDLYITGEMLDADGECGGYNLGWAWLCAIKAADAVNKELCLC